MTVLRLTLPVLGLAAVALTSDTANACGGFFCSTEPIDQSAERIVFAIDEAGETVDVHVQILYQGSAKEFAWILPSPDFPELFLSTDQLFSQLEWQTSPYFNLAYEEEGVCTGGGWWGLDEDVAFEADDAGGGPPNAGSGVTVVAQAQLGNYDTFTLQATDEDELLEWLQNNDFLLPDSLGPALAPYIAEQSYFVAVKLQNDKDAGDIMPLGMRYHGTTPSIPIQLTSIAATPDMRLEAWVFGSERAVPSNYLHVQINEAAIDWINYGQNYEQVITLAADEAGGHAFATDFAGETTPFRGALYQAGRFHLDTLAATTDPAQFVQRMLEQGFPRTGTVQNLLREFIPMPAELVAEGVDESSFYNCLDCYSEYVDDIEFDAEAFAAALGTLVIEPLENAEKLFTDHGWVSRMTSSISPVEMTVDPSFVLNPDMGAVSNQHQARLVVMCGDGLDWYEAPRRIVLADGREILVPPQSWFDENETTMDDFLADLDEPGALIIEQTSASGPPEVITDDFEDSRGRLDDFNDAMRTLLGLDGGDALDGGCNGGCNGSGAPLGGLAALLAGAALARRRR